jgi:hypothetical protein
MHLHRSLIVSLAALALAVVPGVAAAGTAPNDVLVFRTASGKVQLMGGGAGVLPAGVLSRDGSTLLTARVSRSQTLVRRIETGTGRVLAARSIAGAWGFQQAAEDGTRVAGGEGLAPVVLVAAARANGYRGSAAHTRFALLAHGLQGKLRLLTLPGNLGVDALSENGTMLYVIQHEAGEHYTVRGYDLVRNSLSGAIIDKREPDEKMQGLPLARASSADGSWELTLYRRPNGVPFVHALMTTALAAFCIDLPASARIHPAGPSTWGVAVQGTSMYLANARTGWVGVIDYAHFKLLRSTSLGASAPISSPRPLAVGSDGSTLYLARSGGVVPVATGTLVAGAPLTTSAFGSLALGPDGSLLYASGGGATLVLDTRTGEARESLPTARGLTLVGVARS